MATSAQTVSPQAGGSSPRPRRRRLDLGWAVLIGLMAVASALILYLGRGFTFYADEWFFVLYRNGGSVQNLLAGHGGHLVVFPVVLFVGLFKTVGLDAYWAYRVIPLLFVLACSALVYALGRPRVGPIVALAPAGLLLFLGSGWDDILRPFQVSFTAAAAFGLLAILLLDRDDLKGDVAACGSLVLAAGWSGAAIPFMIAVAVGLIVKGRLWRRLWVPLIPMLIYPAWSPRYSDVHTDYGQQLSAAPGYALRMIQAAAEGITGLPYWPALILLIALAVLVVVRLWRIRRSDALAWEMLACGAAFWVATALSQADENTPGAPRYIYMSALVILLIGVGVAPRGSPGRRVAAAVIVLFALCLPSNIGDLLDGADYETRISQYSRAELGAMQLAQDEIPPEFTPPLADMGGVPIPAAPYFAAVGVYESSPADDPGQIAREPDFARRGADRILARAFHVRLVPAPADAGQACVVVPAGDSAQLPVPRSGALIGSPDGSGELSLRQFADSFAVALGPLSGKGPMALEPDPRSTVAGPWLMRVANADAPISVCRLDHRPGR